MPKKSIRILDNLVHQNNLGSRLKQMRQACGKSQLELAEMFGLTNDAVCRFESGDRVPKRQDKIEYMAKLCELTYPDEYLPAALQEISILYFKAVLK